MRKGLVPTTAQALDGHWGWGGGVRGKLCPFQMSILINTFVACHNKVLDKNRERTDDRICSIL